MAMTRDCKSLALRASLVRVQPPAPRSNERLENLGIVESNDASPTSSTTHYGAAIAQLVERIHGKDEVTGSSPVRGSTKKDPQGLILNPFSSHMRLHHPRHRLTFL